MPTSRAATADGVRRRPKDRKAQIARVAAEAFSKRGYHAVGMDDIAAQLDITATALYRHYANKYDLFRAAVLTLGQQLVDATAFCDDEAAAGIEPLDLQARVVGAIADVAIANRDRGGLYRWEGRYLQGEDQARLMTQIRLVNRRIQQPMRQLRPTLASVERWMLSAAALSVIGSVADHRAKLPVAQIRALLARVAADILAAELPTAREIAAEPVVTPRPLAEPDAVGRYEAVLQQSLVLFDKQGYHETSMGQIAAAVGIPTSAIYRYFAGKQDILSAVFHRGADRVSAELASVLAGVGDPTEALRRLVGAYVASSFASPELAYVYYTERVNLSAADQDMLRNVQRATIDSWVRLLVSVRPEVTQGEARFLVQAAMALVIDLGRLGGYANSARLQAGLRRLMLVTLGV
ncbi:TetR/AcrR family transcriptional regulator [[Mycobacterium] wendilense]|uniref:TetR/AcrR family transcriptional regulator n=1 Tax=[Mycobacterium] wendilense TaxID=3064284 RepID=A0ABN9P6X2_9MYCO|nr:TetR/AcrR family transcriptional regulator [Mycolicibacterium sp. MU0050]CAJ1585815.1 TetR/AcrR family transcriptional regulator [Mycolicibacterium sp. MU0050]